MNRKTAATFFVGIILCSLICDCVSQRGEGRRGRGGGRRGGGRRGEGGGRRGGGEGRRGGGGERRGGGGGGGGRRDPPPPQAPPQPRGGGGGGRGLGDLARRALAGAAGVALLGAAADFATGGRGLGGGPIFGGGFRGFRDFSRPAVSVFPPFRPPIRIGRRRGFRRGGFGRGGFRRGGFMPFFFSF